MLSALVIFGLSYLAIVTERVHRTIVALLGATLMLIMGVVTQEEAFHSREYGVDYNVIFLLIGMMIIVNVLRKTGIFEWLAVRAAKRAEARPFRMLVLLSVVTAAVSAFLDNVTTVLLIAPVTLDLARRLGLDPTVYLISEALASNVGGTATLIGDPPNIMIGSKARLGFGDFIVVLTPLAILALVTSLILLWLACRGQLQIRDELRTSVLAMDPNVLIREPTLLRRCLYLLTFTIAGFFFHQQLHLQPATIALLGAGLFMLVAHETDRRPAGATGGHLDLDYLTEVEWRTILFFIGLFILVGGLVKAGVMRAIASELVSFVHGSVTGTTLLVLWGSALLSAIVDNIPYVAAMNPLIVDLARASHPDIADYSTLVHQPDILPLWWALAAGACFGGNGTLIGATANVIVVDLARRAGVTITFGRFLLYGFPVMIATMVVSTVYFWVLLLR
jgi:Na+/H+ antiporter NhaD/arsenite permease-like protein